MFLKEKLQIVVIIPPINFWGYTRRFHYESLAEFVKVVIIPFPISFHRVFHFKDRLNWKDFKKDFKFLILTREYRNVGEKNKFA